MRSVRRDPDEMHALIHNATMLTAATGAIYWYFLYDSLCLLSDLIGFCTRKPPAYKNIQIDFQNCSQLLSH